jgi:hypothetical protein
VTGAGGEVRSVESAVVRSCQDLRTQAGAPLPVLGGGFPATLGSSKARHLKSFLYPPHVTDRLAHCLHAGFVSSHFRRLFLHVMHPVDVSRVPEASLQDGQHTVSTLGLFPLGDAGTRRCLDCIFGCRVRSSRLLPSAHLRCRVQRVAVEHGRAKSGMLRHGRSRQRSDCTVSKKLRLRAIAPLVCGEATRSWVAGGVVISWGSWNLGKLARLHAHPYPSPGVRARDACICNFESRPLDKPRGRQAHSIGYTPHIVRSKKPSPFQNTAFVCPRSPLATCSPVTVPASRTHGPGNSPNTMRLQTAQQVLLVTACSRSFHIQLSLCITAACCELTSTLSR